MVVTGHALQTPFVYLNALTNLQASLPAWTSEALSLQTASTKDCCPW
jgi:hypothetical protein